MANTEPEEQDDDPTIQRTVAALKPRAFNKAARTQTTEETDESFKKAKLANEREARGYALLKALQQDAGKDVIRDLMQQGVDLDVHDTEGNGLLHYAAGHRNLFALTLLINAGADLHAQAYGGITPLMVATLTYGGKDAAVMLAAADPDPSVHVADGAHVLHAAAETHDMTRLVEVLLTRGVPADIEDSKGRTPLYYAIARKRNAADVLCMAGGYREKDLPQLAEAIEKKELYGNEWNWNLLLSHAAKIPQEELKAGFPKVPPVLPPLYDAAAEKIFGEMYAHGSSFRMEKYWDDRHSVNSRDYDGRTPLMAGLDNSGISLWDIRGLAYDTDGRNRDNAGRTALHYAAKHVSPADGICDVLLSRHNDVNAQDIFGRTPLMVTVKGCNHLDRLLSAGANPFHTDLLGRTVLDIAKINNSDIAEDMLMRAVKKAGWNAEELAARSGPPSKKPARKATPKPAAGAKPKKRQPSP